MDDFLLKWRTTVLDMQAATDPIQAKIDRLQAKLDEVAAPYHAQLMALEADIKATALVYGKSYSAHNVKVQYRSGYERTSWDNKALAGYAAAHPEILPFRSVTVVEPSVTIKAEFA